MSKKEQVVEEAIENTGENSTEEAYHFGPGALLKQAREQKSMSLDEVCDRLKLMPKVVSEIESDDYQTSTPPAFYRGYIHNYAELLGLNGEEYCQNFSRIYSNSNSGQTQNVGFTKISVEQSLNSGNWIMRIVSGVVILAVIYATYYLFAEYKILDKFKSEPSSEQSEVQNGDELLFGDTTSGNDGSLNMSSDSAMQALDVQQLPESNDDSGSLSLGSLNTEAAGETSAQLVDLAVNDNPVASDSNAVSFTFTEDCWIKVTDSTNAVLAIGIKQKARSFTLNGVAPYQLTIGNPAGVSIQFDGETIDMSAYASDQTAKLTLGN